MTRCGSAFLFIVILAPTLHAAGGAGEPLPGTQPLTAQGDLASQMVEGIDRFLLRETNESPARRDREFRGGGERSDRLARILGATDELVNSSRLEVVAEPGESGIVGRGTGFDA